MADIFISYAREDVDRVRGLVAALESEGYSVWWDTRIEGGDKWPDEIEEALTAAKAVLVIWTGTSKKKHWVREEALDALENQKLIPLQFEPGAIPFGFRSVHAENFVGWDGDRASDSWQRLILSLSELAGAPKQQKTFVPQAPNASGSLLTGLLTALAGAGIFAGLYAGMGILGGAIALAGFFFLLFRAADVSLSPRYRGLAKRWLLPVKGGVRISVAETFNALFEAVFGRRHLSFKCLSRSVLASLVSFALIVGLAWFIFQDFRTSLNGAGELTRNIIVMTVITNIIGDYVSLWQTRIFLRWGARAPILLPYLVLVDALLTALLYVAVISIVFVPFEQAFIGFADQSFYELEAFDFFYSQIEVLGDTPMSAWGAEQWILAFSLATTYVTSAWLWLVLVFGPISRLLLGRNGQTSSLGRVLGANSNPMTVVGLVTAALVVGIGGVLALYFDAAGTNEDILQDCDSCPEMVVIPAGTFAMGSETGFDRERPVHEVTIARPFAVGRFEVTWIEWQACVTEGGCDGEAPQAAGSDEGWGKGKRPVINISWGDAQAYVAWISKKTGHDYSLLSEAQWEHAARAGTTTRYSFGDTISASDANYAGDRNLGRTQPVGAYAPNAFGLYDMHGNVWEWTEDCWNENYEGAPTDGSAWTTGECSFRVLRGGSWYYDAVGLRSASRNRTSTANRNDDDGFRVMRELEEGELP